MSDAKYTDTVERWDKIQKLIAETATPKNRKYIYRADKSSNCSLRWVVNIRIGDLRINKSFTDNMNGGKNSALLAAITYRNNQIIKHKLIFIKGLKKQPFDTTKKGVCFSTKKDGIYKYSIFTCYWQETVDGKQIRKQKIFSVNKHGMKGAYRKAATYRRKKLKELYG